MRPEDFDRVVEQLKLTPGQARRLRNAAGKQGVNVRVRLLPGDSLREGAGTRDARRPPFVDDMLRSISPALRATLSEIEPQVLQWVNASDQNADFFAKDPLAALERAVPGLDRRKLSALADLRQRHSKTPPGSEINIKSVRVDRRQTGRGGPNVGGE